MNDIAKLMRERVRATASGSSRWYDIRNADGASGDAAVLTIYDEISWWGLSADQFAKDLAEVTASKIEVQINSPGGSVFDGVAIFNSLRSHPAHVTTRVDGVAASIASVIAQAGDHRVMLTGAQMMVHQARGVAIGTASDMREFADMLERQNANIANIYASRSGKDAAAFTEIFDTGTDHWMTGQEAVDMGLADEVVDPGPKKGDDAADAKVQIDLTGLADILERATAALDQAALAATKTSPAGEREEPIESTEDTVNRAEAQRLLASLALPKEAS